MRFPIFIRSLTIGQIKKITKIRINHHQISKSKLGNSVLKCRRYWQLRWYRHSNQGSANWKTGQLFLGDFATWSKINGRNNGTFWKGSFQWAKLRHFFFNYFITKNSGGNQCRIKFLLIFSEAKIPPHKFHHLIGCQFRIYIYFSIMVLYCR